MWLSPGINPNIVVVRWLTIVALPGVKWGEDYRLDHLRCSECRTCRFENVCLNHSSLEIMFYKGSQDVLYYHEQSGEAQYKFPNDFLMLGMAGTCHSDFCAKYLQVRHCIS